MARWLAFTLANTLDSRGGVADQQTGSPRQAQTVTEPHHLMSHVSRLILIPILILIRIRILIHMLASSTQNAKCFTSPSITRSHAIPTLALHSDRALVCPLLFLAFL